MEEIINDAIDKVTDPVPTAVPTVVPTVVAAQTEDKKKPGRPKKKLLTIPVEVRGIVAQPCDPENMLELVYYNPAMFKKLLLLCKQYAVSEIYMYFDETGMTIKTKDHLGKSNIYMRINGKKMHWYYCVEPMKVCIKRASLDKVLSNLGKEHYKITIILKENYRRMIYMNVKDSTYNNDNTYEIDVSYSADEPVDITVDDDTNYPIKFELTSKHFKSQISSIADLSQMFIIQKNGADPLQITFDKAQSVHWTGIYPDSNSIKLVSTVPADDIFSVGMVIDHIKPFSNSNIGDFVQIAASMTEKMSFTTRLDKAEDGEYACTVKIYTEIKDYRRT